MAYGDGSQAIREHAWKSVLEPAWKRRGSRGVTVRVKQLMREMEAKGFPKNQPRNFCLALQKRSFLAEMEEKGIHLEKVEGPRSGTSSTVKLHFIISSHTANGARSAERRESETPRQRAERLVGQLSGLFREEIKAQGGAEAVIQWLRSDED